MKVPHNSRKKQLKQAKNGLNTAPNAVIVVPKYPNCCTPLINVIGGSPTAHSGRAYSIQNREGTNWNNLHSTSCMHIFCKAWTT